VCDLNAVNINNKRWLICL